MKTNKTRLSISNFDSVTKEKASNWYYFVQQKSLKDAIHLCTALIEDLKDILNNRTWNNASSEEYNKVLVSAVIFKAFQDFAELGKITSDKNWGNENDKIELVWLKHWDCRERLEFVNGNIESPIIDWIIENLDRLLENYLQVFGNGLYASPEIVVKKEICSICKKDIRACEHIKGYGYNGEVCRGIAKDFEFKAVSLVTVPKDPRCRVWPWKMKDDGTFNTAIMTFSQIDDFLRE